MNNNYENKILDAIQTLVDSAVSNAGYDKTIKGIISKCVNQNTGKYVVRYQDSSFYAYSNDLDSIYSGGTPVYVLVPGNDMSQTKTILGSVDKLGTEYITLSESSAAYQEVGTSVITPNGTIPGISSYKAGGDSLVIYDRTSVNNLVNVDTEGAELYFQQSNHMEIGGTFTTILNEEQKRKGNYGLVFDMDFKNGEEIVNKQYVIDINSMTGNPYSYNLGSEQSAIFEIDGANFYRLNSITLECKNFPKSATPYTSDIFVKDIILKALTPLTRDELANNSLTFITKQGIYFNENDSASATRLIETEVKINKKVVPNTGGLLRFYWFKEDSTVSITSPDYLPFGGPGWKCLNEYNVIDETNNIRDYITDTDTLTVVKSENPAKENEYKCVVIYNNEIQVERNIIIYNQASEYTITIESDQGNYFKYNEGNPTLICSVNPAGTYTYIWTETDSTNRTEVLTETSNIYSVQLGSIAGFSKFTCSVYSNENFLGKSDIVITNSWDPEDNSYALVMENGDQIFKYNEKGIAPTNKSLEKPIVLKPLQFIVYDELGHQVDDNKIVATDVSWYVPKENTMIKISDAGIEPVEDGDYLVYTGLKTINFTIASVYNIKKLNNTIKLVVKYNDRVLNTVSELEFIKEGEIGSNGTDFICRIVPNVAANAQIPNYPIYTYNTTTSTGAMNYTLAANNKWFKVQLYKDGVQIYEGVASGTSEENKAVTVDWSMLTNKYSSTVSDATSFSVNNSTGEFSYTNLSDTNLDRAANITKVTVTYDGATYYATMPIILVRVANANYKLDLENNTGFRYVMYTTDGLNPVYDSSNPFALIAYNGTTDITNVNNITFTYSTLGQTYNGTGWVNENNFIVKTHGASNPLAKNEADYRPIEKFDGLSTNNAIKCVVKENSSEIARAYLPIHFYLNRFGNAALNGWDGNHIEINNNGGFILAPQVGAGKKENDNSYTGIFMGNVREAGSSVDEVGLYGYYKGTRTIALDTKDGSARFGKQGAGQIVIDPAAADYDGKGTARLYSNDYSVTYTAPSAMEPAQTKYTAGFSYWRKVSSTEYRLLREGVDYTIGSTIANTDYVWNGGAGLEIDLNDPHIRFGSGKFRVDSDGQVYATGFVTVNNLEAGDYTIPSGSIDVGSGDTLNDYMSTTNNTLTNLQSQIDGAVQFWNGQTIPTLNNYPASDWTTEEERRNHQADIYTVIYDEQGEWKQGKSYRFDKVNGTWLWIELTDQEMSAVQALAASKAKVFIKDNLHPNPTPPYNIGDMWFADGEMYRCKTAKGASDSYAAADWELATDYTDDTAVNTLKQNVISSSEVQYALGNDAETAPTTGWAAETPVWTEGKYVWQRTVTTYADNTQQSPHVSISDPVCIQGAKGEPGGDGRSIVVDTTTLSYQNSTSGTTIPTGTWTSSPSPEEGKYTWTRTITTYKLSGTSTSAGSSTSYSVAYTGPKGDQGRSLVKQTPLHYLKSNDTAPAAPTSHVTSTSTDPGVWTTAMPEYIDGYTYFACSENEFSIAPLYEWTNVVKDNGLNEALTVANQAKESVDNILDDIDNPTNEKTGKYIDIDDALSVPMIDFKIYGDTEQDTTTGKQLIKKDGLSTPTSDTTFWLEINTSGFEPLTDGWGKFYYDNTSSSSTKWINAFIKLGGVQLETNTQYTIIIECRNIASNNVSTYTLGQQRSDEAFNESVGGTPSTTQKKYLVTTKSSFSNVNKGLRMFITCGASKMCNFEMRASIVKGNYTSTDYTYEPYTNGASPNPDYPQEVQVVTGNNEINIVNKNLCDCGEYTLASTTSTIIWNAKTSSFIPVFAGDVYTLSYYVNGVSEINNTYGYAYVYAYDKNKTKIDSYGDFIHTRSAGGVTKTISSDIAYLKVCYGARGDAGTKFIAQLEKGSIATNFEPYKSFTQEINLGKNLFDKSNWQKYGFDITIGTSTYNDHSTANKVANGIPIKVEGGKYYVLNWTNPDGVTINEFNLYCYDSSGILRYVHASSGNSLAKGVARKLENDVAYINISSFGSLTDEQLQGIADTLQLEKGTQATSFSSYKEPIELCKIGEYQDYIYKDNGSWYLHKEIGKYTLTGSEPSSMLYWNAEVNGMRLILDNAINNIANAPLYCNRFKAVQSASQDNNYARLNRTTGANYTGIWFGNVSISGVSDGATFKTYASSNEIIVYYPLATPTNTIIEDTELIEQLETLMSTPLFENVNHITDETFNISPDLYVKYYRNTAINQNFASKDDLNNVKGTADKAYEQVQSTNVLYTTTNTINEPGASAVWLDTLPSVSDKYIWQKIVYTFLDASKNYESSPACIYTPSKITNELQYCLCSQNNYDETKITDAWQSESFPWDDSYYESTGVGNITILRYQFVRNKYTDTNKETDNVTYSEPVLDQAWYMFGYKLAAESLERQALSNNINNNIVTINNQDGITVSGEDSSYGIRLTSLGMQFLLENQTTHVREWTTVWDIYGNLDASAITVTDLRADNILSGTLTLNTAENNGSFVLVNGNGNTNINGNGVTVNSLGANTYVQLKNNAGGITAVANNTEYFGTKPDTKTTTMDNAVVKNDFSFNTSVKVVHVTNGIAFIGI